MIEYENLKKANQPFFESYQKKYLEVLDSGKFILGEQVQIFESAFAAYCGTSHCVGVGNGMDALTLALRSFGFPAGSEVIVPSNTYVATIFSIINSGLKPVLAEPDIGTYNIDPLRAEELIKENTVAIMAVHLYGKCCNMDEMKRLGEQYNLRIIEDCAQAHGASFKQRKAGSFGDFGAFSFYPTKNLGALGDGGGLTTNSEYLFKKILQLRNYGSEKKYYNDVVGVNSRLDELQASFLLIKLAALENINTHKRKLADLYQKGLKADFIKPLIDDEFQDVFHIYNIRHPRREQLREYLLKNGIQTEIHYPVPPHRQKALQEIFKNHQYPISEEIHATTLSLPISFMHTEDDVLYVIDKLNAF